MSLTAQLLTLVVVLFGGQTDSPVSQLSLPLTRSWSYLSGGLPRYIPPVVDDHQVYAPLVSGKILALSLETGEIKWERELGGMIQIPMQVSRQGLLVATASSQPTDGSASILLLLDTKTGVTLQSRPFNRQLTSISIIPDFTDRTRTRLFVGSDEGILTALNPSSLETLWEFKTDGPIHGHVSFDNTSLYVGSDDHSLYALDTQTGLVRWRFKTDGYVRGRIEIAPNRLYVGSFDGWVYYLDQKTGKLIRKRRTGAAIQSKPTLVGKHLIVPSYDNFVYSFSAASGDLLWKVKLSGRIIADPLVQDKAVLISVLRDHRLIVLQAEDGKEINSFDLGEDQDVIAAPAMSRSMIVVSTTQGLLAIRVSPATSP